MAKLIKRGLGVACTHRRVSRLLHEFGFLRFKPKRVAKQTGRAEN